jgi:integrase
MVGGYRDAAGAASAVGVSCRLHDLRQTNATTLVNAKTNARVVSDVLGHATVAFTLRTYYSPGDDEIAGELEYRTVTADAAADAKANEARREQLEELGTPTGDLRGEVQATTRVVPHGALGGQTP